MYFGCEGIGSFPTESAASNRLRWGRARERRGWKKMNTFHEAEFYERLPEGDLVCRLCPQQCRITVGKSGFCGIRINREGKLETINYGQVSGIGLDPIEKKPLYHYYPGRLILSVGTVGCNLACRFCQNWQISREKSPTKSMTPEQLVELAEELRQEKDNIGVAYTYSEPGVWYEFLIKTMPRIRERGLKNVLVTNAFLEPEPWKKLLKWTDAANIDLKGFTESYYQRLCGGKLAPVLENIKAASSLIHMELTTLIIPGENDRPEQIRKMAQWIAALDPEIPLHLSRYFPNYRLRKPATPLITMEESLVIAKKYLKYVYLGNVGKANNTYCPECGSLLVERDGFQTRIFNMNICRECGKMVRIIIGT
jgi:pyruvate formate lyase activating enzyme